MNSLLNAEIQFPDGDFSISAIARMKVMAGIDICHELAPKHREMIKQLSLPQSISYNQSPINTIMVVFNEWLAGKTALPPTWKEMMALLREIRMNHLSVRIVRYFGKSPVGSTFGEKSLTTSHNVHAALSPGNMQKTGNYAKHACTSMYSTPKQESKIFDF